jgi:hypothetical protein
MIKNIKLSTIAAIAVITVIGCGSSSTTDTNTGTSIYKDAAVQGVDFVCGKETGKTDAKGTFTFEKGQECKFSLAGIPLRTTPAVQVHYQREVVVSVGHDVKDVSGDVRTDDQVQAHLAQTQTEITKTLLAGKTFYVVGEDGDDNKIVLFKIVVNKEATQFKNYKLDGTFTENENIKIVGNKMIFTNHNNDDSSYTLISQENGYVFADDRQTDGTKDVLEKLYMSLIMRMVQIL